MSFIRFLKGLLIASPILIIFEIIIGECKIGEGILMEIFVLGILFCWFYFGTGKKKRCPFCKKRHALIMVKSEVISQEDVSVLKEMKIRNNQRNETGTVEQYIPGVKTTYKEYYTCKYCGTKQSGSRHDHLVGTKHSVN